MTARLPLVLGPNGLPQQLQSGDTLPLASTSTFGVAKVDGTTVTESGGVLSAVGGGGGGGGSSTMQSFATVSDAMSAVISNGVSAVNLAGYNKPGDGGQLVYSRVNSLPSFYVDPPLYPRWNYPAVPPSFVSGAPNTIFGKTFQNYQLQRNGVSSQPIVAGSLVILVSFGFATGSVPASYVDSVGNVYVLAVGNDTGQVLQQVAIYYCANPKYAPIGTTFASTNVGSTCVYIYQACGYTDAVLDKTASSVASGSVNGVTLTTPALTASPELVIGAVAAGGNPIFTLPAPAYTPPAGWFNLSIPISACNPVSCIAVNSTSAVTYNPTWSGTVDTQTVMATFKNGGSATPGWRSVLNPSYWAGQPEWPVQLAQYGILPGPRDNAVAYTNFSMWLASIAPASETSVGAGSNPDGWCTISAANPAVVSFFPARNGPPFTQPYDHGLHAGQMFSVDAIRTDDALPAPFVGGQINYVQYGGVTPSTVTASGTGIFGGDGQQTLTKGPSISTAGAATQSGANTSITYNNGTGIATVTTSAPHGLTIGNVRTIAIAGATASQYNGLWACTITGISTFTYLLGAGAGLGSASPAGTYSLAYSFSVYGEGWAEITLDPGIYYSSNNQLPGIGYGYKKIRINGYGAKIQTNAYVFAFPLDTNTTATGGTGQCFQTQFKKTDYSSGQQSFIQMLPGNEALAANYNVNSWLCLMQCDVQGNGGPNNANYFEFVQIFSIDAGTGVITLYDPLLYNYRSTLVLYGPQITGDTHGLIGPATAMLLPDTFDQCVELRGIYWYGVGQETFAGLQDIRLIDCEIMGWGFKTGPTPSFCRRFLMQNCRIHNAITEVDKMVDICSYIDCTFDWTSRLFLQSATINKCLIERCTMPGDGFFGTPKQLTVKGSTIGRLRIGPVYGTTERILLEDSHIQGISNVEAQFETIKLGLAGFSFTGGTIKIDANTNGWFPTVPGPNSNANPVPWAIPGAKVIIYSDSATAGGALGLAVFPTDFSNTILTFTVLDCYMDNLDGSGQPTNTSNYYIDTDLLALPTADITFNGTLSGTTLTVTGGTVSPATACIMQKMSIVATAGGTLPAGTTITVDYGIPNADPTNASNHTYTLSHSAASGAPTAFKASANMWFLQHPCPRVSVRNCTGGRFVTDQQGAPQDIPLLSYFSRTYKGFPWATSGAQANFNLVGTLDTNDYNITINVTKAYTGVIGPSTCVIYIFGWNHTGSNYYPVFVKEVIDLTTVGKRVIKSSGSSALGADSLVDVPFWTVCGLVEVLINGSTSHGSEALSLMPSFNITGYADQNVEFATMLANNTTSGLDMLSDTFVGSGL